MSEQVLRAFHGDEAVAQKYRSRVEAHRIADEIIQGSGWINGKGCAVGCTLDRYDGGHQAYPVELGIPQVLAHLEDHIHEGLPLADAKLWPGRFLNAPKVGADLSGVWPDFAAWLLADPEAGVIRFAQTDEQRAIISEIAQMWRDRVPTSDPKWRSARDKAREVRNRAWRAAAYANAAAAAADAAASYANAAAAADAADAAASYANAATAADAARTKHWRACADKLVELMAAALVVQL